MRVVCPHCKAGYNISEERVKQFGEHIVFPCPSCKGKIEINLSSQSSDPVTSQATMQVAPGDMTGDVLKKLILSKVNDLPPMPQVAQHARRVTADKNSTFSDVAKVIETDQSIAAKVLKLANSAYYGVMGSVTSIQHASMILGIKTLNQLLEIACTSKFLTTKLDGYGLDAGQLWRHSLAVAGCARSLAKKRNPNVIDDAFSAGLIHDCGKLILDHYIFERKNVFDNFLKDGNKTFIEAERTILGFDHAQIAANVCEKWEIPKRLVSAIQYHHTPAMLRFNELALIVHASDAIMHAPETLAAGSDSMDIAIDSETLKFLNLDRKQIPFFQKEANDYMEKTISSI